MSEHLGKALNHSTARGVGEFVLIVPLYRPSLKVETCRAPAYNSPRCDLGWLACFGVMGSLAAAPLHHRRRTARELLFCEVFDAFVYQLHSPIWPVHASYFEAFPAAFVVTYKKFANLLDDRLVDLGDSANMFVVV